MVSVGSNAGLGVCVADGKYCVQCDGDGRMRALRYSQPWRDLTGDGMVLALVQEIQSLRGEITEAKAILRKDLDRDYDKKDTLRTLVVVAVNSLHYARQSSPNNSGQK